MSTENIAHEKRYRDWQQWKGGNHYVNLERNPEQIRE